MNNCNCNGTGFTLTHNSQGIVTAKNCVCHLANLSLGDLIDRIMSKGLKVQGAHGTRFIGLVDIAKMSDAERLEAAA